MKPDPPSLIASNLVPAADPSQPAPPLTAAMPRRQFLRLGTAAVTATAMFPEQPVGASAAASGAAERLNMRTGGIDLIVQPVLMYRIPERRPVGAWRDWSGVYTQEAVNQEAARIERELTEMSESAPFGMRILPLVRVSNAPQAQALRGSAADVFLVYATGGGGEILDALAGLGKWLVIFTRRESGPFYLWNQIVHSRFLRGHSDQLRHPTVSLDDVVVDDQADVVWRLQALYGLKNTIGRRIVCVGEPSGWSWPQAPQLARERFQLDMVNLPISEVNSLIVAGRRDAQLMAECERETERYIRARGVRLVATREAVRETFLLRRIFYDQMAKAQAYAVTTFGCMASYAGIMPCLTLTLINDDGYMAYCESDFVVIPSGMLLHFIAGKPTYLCNPTHPHRGRMVFAHCSAPRRMDGERLEPVQLVTYFESDQHVATHVEFRRGQALTILIPDFEAKEWLGMTGRIVGTPQHLHTCRAQVDVAFDADTQEVARNLRGFHCMLAYGDYTREVTYAASKVGISVKMLRA